MDERLLALADVINSTRPDGSPRLQAYREKKQRSLSSISYTAESGSTPNTTTDTQHNKSAGANNSEPSERVQHQHDLSLTQSKWLKMAKKTKMVSLLRKPKSLNQTVKEEGLKSAALNQQEVAVETDSKPVFTIGGESEEEDSQSCANHDIRCSNQPSFPCNSGILPLPCTSLDAPLSQVVTEGHNDGPSNSISIQTDPGFFVAEKLCEQNNAKPTKVKKRKTRTRSQQVSLPNGHLTLSEYQQQQLATEREKVDEKAQGGRKFKADKSKPSAIESLIEGTVAVSNTVGKIGVDTATAETCETSRLTTTNKITPVPTTETKTESQDATNKGIKDPKPKHRVKSRHNKVYLHKLADHPASKEGQSKLEKGTSLTSSSFIYGHRGAVSDHAFGDGVPSQGGRKRKSKHDYSDNIDTGVLKEIKKEKISRKEANQKTTREHQIKTKSDQSKLRTSAEKTSKDRSSSRTSEGGCREGSRTRGERRRRDSQKPPSQLNSGCGKPKAKADDTKKQDQVKPDEPLDEEKIEKIDIEKGEPEKSDISDNKPQLITEEPTADEEDKFDPRPPGDEELTQLEELIADQEDGIPEDIDPEIVARVEEQIFEKIKYYKEIKSGVRLKPWFMKKKMKLRAEANTYTARFEGKLSSGGGGPGFVPRLKVSFSKAMRELSNYLALIVPWESKIKNIESYFGTVVASYFTFLRWLFWINIVMSAICGIVIIMPEVLFGPDMGSVDYKSVPAGTEAEASYLKALWNFEGYAAVSPFFYGYYSSIKSFESGYRMPFAYMIGNLMIFAYSFITILRQIAENSKDEKASDKDDNFTFSWKAFSSWDYMIGNEETAKNKYKALVIAIRESVTETKESAKKISTKLKFLRVLSNFLVLVVLASSTYAIFLTVDRSKEFEERKKQEGPDSVSWLESNEVSLVLSLVTAFFPILFDIIASFEDYHPRVALQWSLKRIMVLYLLNLYTLYIALYGKIQDIEEAAELANKTFYEGVNMSAIVPCDNSGILSSEHGNKSQILATSPTIPPKNDTTPSCGMPVFVPEVTCWETMVGQELVKLTVFDFVTTVGLIYITEFFRAVIIRFLNACWCWDMELGFPCYAEFSLAENLLHLVYNQGMIWMGTLFCPVLPMVNLIKLLCLFYVRAWSVMVCNVPHERIFKAGSENFYLMLLLFMLYVVMIPIAFAMVSIRPSRQCGPYQETEYMYLIITEWFREVFHESLFSILRYLTSAGALIPIFILLLLCIYYLSSSNSALKGTVLDLKKQLQYERTEGKKRVFNINKNMAQQNSAGEVKRLSRSSSKLTIDKGKLTRNDSSQKLTDGNEPKVSMSALLNASRFVSRLKLKASRLQPPVEEA